MAPGSGLAYALDAAGFLKVNFMFFRVFLLIVLASALAGCRQGPAAPQQGAGTAPLILSAEDLHTVSNKALLSGPAVTGTVQPERKADLRAEIQSIVLQVLKENGDQVRKGELLVRMDETAIRETLGAAEAASRAAAQAHDQAQRQFERMKTLRSSGMTSTQAMEDAEVRRNSAQSELEAAKTRAVSARQQLSRTEVRAPFDGVISDRKVSAGDTAQLGKELLKVIDPASMRFEGMVSADHIGTVKAGQAVSFRVNGYGTQDFTGKVRRVNPAANATTRQVEVLVDFTGQVQPTLAGLYAEGRIDTASASGLTLPATALVREGDTASAWRVQDGKLHKVAVAIGERDPRSGDFVLKSGLSDGDRVLRYPGALLKDGQAVQAPGAAAEAPTLAASPPGK